MEATGPQPKPAYAYRAGLVAPDGPGYVQWRPRWSQSESVTCVWLSRPSKWALPTVLPDAAIDVVWDGASLVVAGPDTKPVTVPHEPGTAFVGARFRPGRAPAFLGVPASELLDKRVGLAELWGRAFSERTAEHLASARTPEDAADMLDATLARRAEDTRGRDEVADALVELLKADIANIIAANFSPARAGGAVVKSASRALGVGERRLHRRCCAAVGYGPKTLERVLRFQHALRLSAREPSLALLAARSGYSDQAHLGRECQRLAGVTPSVLFKTARLTSS